MAKISELSDGGSLQSTDFLIAVRSGGNVKVQADGNLSLGTVTADGSFNATSAGSYPSFRGAGNYGGGIGFIDTNVSGMYTDTSGANLKFFTNQSASDTAASKVAMTINGSGNVGIGTSPSAGLHVLSDTNPVLKLDRGSANTANANLYYNGTLTGQLSAANADFQISASGASTPISFYTNGSQAMAIDASGNVGIGTASPGRNLEIAGTDTDVGLNITKNTVGTVRFAYDSTGPYILDEDSNPFRIYTGGSERLRIDSSGNVGIGIGTPGVKLHVEGDTDSNVMIVNNIGTAPNYIFDVRDDGVVKFRVDPSGNVGIGTDSPASLVTGGSSPVLTIGGTDGGLTTGEKAGALSFITSDGSYTGTYSDGIAGEIVSVVESATGAAYGLAFYTGTISGSNRGERVRIDNSGNVGIGTSSPSELLHVSEGSSGAGRSSDADTLFLENNGNAGITIGSSTTGLGSVRFADSGGTGRGVLLYDHSSDFMSFHSAGGERMRIDSSGNLLVGTTDTTPGIGDTGAGVSMSAANGLIVSRSGEAPLNLNRNTDDGDFVLFRRDGAGTTVGSIASTDGTDLQIGSGNCYLRFDDADDKILPTNAAGAKRDNVFDLGHTDARFDDIYASNGTIQTSDRNEKQDIEALSDAEQRVAVAAKGLLRKFRWISSVEENGDDARIHFGIIAQDLQAAFEAEGLDAGRYAMFINSTWTDEETGEERSRMGVRYSELLAFIIAAI